MQPKPFLYTSQKNSLKINTFCPTSHISSTMSNATNNPNNMPSQLSNNLQQDNKMKPNLKLKSDFVSQTKYNFSLAYF